MVLNILMVQVPWHLFQVFIGLGFKYFHFAVFTVKLEGENCAVL